MTFSGRVYLFLGSHFFSVKRKLDWLLGKPESDEISSYVRNVIRSLKIHQDAKCTINLILSHFISFYLMKHFRTMAGKSQSLQHKHKLKTESQNPQH